MSKQLTKETFTQLTDLEEELSAKLSNVRQVLALSRKLCTHDMGYSGRDSHHDYYKCKICGTEERDG